MGSKGVILSHRQKRPQLEWGVERTAVQGPLIHRGDLVERPALYMGEVRERPSQVGVKAPRNVEFKVIVDERATVNKTLG